MLARVLVGATGFSVGFGLMFFLISLPFLGISSINSLKNVVSLVGGSILIFVGLMLIEVIKIPFLSKYFKFFDYKFKKVEGQGFWALLFGSFLVGMSFSGGWAPCIGPVLLG
ncbi:MAG: cytochrome c biogenesis protein CcdA, partial [bacterium]